MKHVIFAIVLLALLAVIWAVGLPVLKLPWLHLAIASGGLVLLSVIGWVVLWWVLARRAKQIEKGLMGAGAIAEMEKSFHQYLDALKASPNGKSALATLPWYAVIGSPGSGKTTSLQESGLAFSSLGSGLRAIRGIGGTLSCDWWFTDQAIFLDTAGRYTTQPLDHDEWLRFLDLVKRNRPSKPLAGVIVFAAISDLIKTDEAGVAAQVQPIRERLTEISNRLGVVLPVYVIFSKADLVGGFKDFFNSMGRTDRDQPWGYTFDRAAIQGKELRDVFAQAMGTLVAGVQARRLQALAGSKGDASLSPEKIQLFPGNVAAVQKWLSVFVSELFRPGPGHSDLPFLRGFYLCSGTQPPKPGEKPVEKSTETTKPDTRMPGASATLSIFFTPGEPASKAESVDSRKSFFIRDLFLRVILPDHQLAGLRASAVRRRLVFRGTIAVVSGIAAVLALSWITVRFIGDRSLLASARSVGSTALIKQQVKAGNLEEQLTSLDLLRGVLVDAERRATPVADQVATTLQEHYFPGVARYFVAPAAERLRSELEALSRAKDQKETDYGLYTDLFRSYLMLTGAPNITMEGATLERTMLDQGRWFLGLMPNATAKPGPELERQGRQHLAYLITASHASTGWQARADDTLVSRIRASLGDAIFIQGAYAEAINALQEELGRLGRDQLVGSDQGLLNFDYEVPGVYTEDGWNRVMQSALDDRATQLVRRLAETGINRSRDEIKKRLRTLYAADYNRAWLKLVANAKPARPSDLADCIAKLRSLTGPDSPYREFVKAVARQQAVDVGGEGLNLLPANGEWMLKGLDATKELVKALEAYQAKTDPTKPIDAAIIGDVCSAADLCQAAYTQAVGGIDSLAARTAAAQCLANLMEAAQFGAVAAIAADIDRQWRERISPEFLKVTTDKFPFKPSAETEVPPAQFAGLFNPQSGMASQAVKAVEDLRGRRFGGRELIPVTWEYQRFAEQIGKIHQAMFLGNSAEPSLAFAVTLRQREGVKDVSLAIGSTVFGLYDRPDRKGQFAWKMSSTPGAKLSIALATDQWLTKDFGTPLWGILRLLRDGKPVAGKDNALELTWTFDAKGHNRSYLAGGVLDAPALAVVIPPEFFVGINCPTKVTR